MRPMEIRKMSSRVSQAKTVDYISEPSENTGPLAYSESVALVYSVFGLLRSLLSRRTNGTLGRVKRLLIRGYGAQKKNSYF